MFKATEEIILETPDGIVEIPKDTKFDVFCDDTETLFIEGENDIVIEIDDSIVEEFFNKVIHEDEEGIPVDSVEVKEDPLPEWATDENSVLRQLIETDTPADVIVEAHRRIRAAHHGKVIKKSQHIGMKKHMSSAQRTALAKARRKSHTAKAKRSRVKSMHARHRAGL
jgi:hypothetical protein